ncbi:MAG: oligosaccharide flippase family protein [Phycisphaerales bacterium]|nr:MAG: oligosaccharide flippase family protein [Phycisphaerales bacterium]
MTAPVTTSKRLIHNTFFNVAALMSNAVIGFFLIRFFLGRLGEARYGVWVLISSLFRYRGILSMGLNSAINRHIPVCLAKDDREGIAKVISTALFFFSTLAVLVALLSFLLSAKVGDWFAVEPELVETAGRLVLITGLCFAISSPLQLTSAVLSGLQRYDVIGIVTLAILATRTVLVVILLLRGNGLLTMGLVFGISEIGTRALQYIFVQRLLPGVTLAARNVDLKLLKDMLFYGMNTFMYAMGALVMYKASDLIIGIFLGTAQVSRFAVATAGVLLLSQFLQAFTAAIKPAVSDLDARDEHSRVQEIAFLTQKYSLLVILPAACFLILLGREFLTVWVGPKFPDPAVVGSLAVVLTVLTVGHCLRLTQHSNFLVLVGRGEHKVFGLLTAMTAVVCVCSSILTVKFLGWGLTGIAWCNAVPVGLVSGLILPVYFNRKMRITFQQNLARVWWPALLGSLPAVALMAAWKLLAPPDSWIELLVVVAATAVTTSICGWYFSLQLVERRRLLQVLRRKRRRPQIETDEVPLI